jgi:hypothetical protein
MKLTEFKTVGGLNVSEQRELFLKLQCRICCTGDARNNLNFSNVDYITRDVLTMQ